MSTNFSIPPLRELPAEALAARKSQLLSEIRGARRSARAGGRAGQRRLAFSVVAIAVLVILFATPAFGLRSALGDLFGRSDIQFSDASPAASVIKRDFAEMSTGAPRGMDPKALAGESRLVGKFDYGDRTRRVWVAPTASGGFCFTFEGVSGGCHPPAAAYDPLTFDGGFVVRGDTPAIARIAGRIFDPAASRLQLEFEDGRILALPFVFVSEPINAGFYLHKPTESEQRPGHRPLRLVLLDRDGTQLAEERFDWAEHARRAERLKDTFKRPAQLLPSESALPPAAPLLEARADGARVSVGSNGVAIFDTSGLAPERRAMIDGAATFSCYRVTKRDGGLRGHQYGHYGRHGGTVAVRLYEQGAVDACDIRGSHGRTWSDKLRSHGVVEFAFNDLGRRWLQDRAAARDLALFVSSNSVQEIRRLPPSQQQNVLHAYGDRVVTTSTGEAPTPDRIGFTLTSNGITFTRRSESGYRFFVEIANGAIADHNMRELARVR